MLTELKVKLLAKEIRKALWLIERRHGVVFKLGSVSFCEDFMTASIIGSIPDAKQIERDYDRRQAKMHLPARGSTVYVLGDAYTIHGWDENNENRPVVLSKDGQFSACKPIALREAKLVADPKGDK